LEEAGHKVSIINGEALKVGQLNETIRRLMTKLEYYLSTALKQMPPLYRDVMTNSRHHIWDIMIEQIGKENPDIIGLGLVTVKMTSAKIICQRIKEAFRNIPIVLGGIHPTSLPVETLNQIPEADFVVVGEGEETMGELLRYLGNQKEYKLHSIKGLAYRDSDGVPIVNEPRALIENLDALPFPRRETGSGKLLVGEIITGRGCPFRCKFCASHVM